MLNYFGENTSARLFCPVKQQTLLPFCIYSLIWDAHPLAVSDVDFILQQSEDPPPPRIVSISEIYFKSTYMVPWSVDGFPELYVSCFLKDLYAGSACQS